MHIGPININSHKCQNKNNSISFEAMKKADFRGIDFAVVEKFKAPIEKFDVLADFQNWAGCLVKKIKNTNFLARKAETIAQRKGMLKVWFNYVIEENGAYTKAIQLLILSAITKNLGENDDNLPPTLNKGVLADCVSELNNELEKDKKAQFDFNKMYQNKLRAYYLEDTKTGESGTKWVVIPSKKHDPKNFESNVKKLKVLSHKSWCTKSFSAEPYLSEGDFHVYLENGEPKIGIRFIYDEIEEIQGVLNNSRIPLQYLNEVEKYINKNKFELGNNSKKEIEFAQLIRQEINIIKDELFTAIKANDAAKIYEYFGIKVEKDEKGNLLLSEYRQPDYFFTYKDLEIDENELFKNVIVIDGNARFQNSDLKSLYNLKKINGNADFFDSKIIDLSNLESIGGNANFDYSFITDLGDLKKIGGNAIFCYSQVTDLGNLEAIGGDVEFNYSEIINLGNLKFIGRCVDFSNSQIIDLRNLHSIGGDADFRYCKIKNLGKLKSIAKNVYLQHSELTASDFESINVRGDIR